MTGAGDRLAHYLDATPAIYLTVHAARQTLTFNEGGAEKTGYAISTARRGLGNRENSQCTPTGIHRIAAKIGAGAPLGAIFRGRVDTGLRWPVDDCGGEDLILSRILWLEGLEDDINRGANIDSYARYIYIHGTNHEEALGTPASHGCVRMRNHDIIELFGKVHEGTIVIIR